MTALICPFASMDVRLPEQLQNQPLTQIAGQPVDCTIDGYKFRLADNSWLMIRFSGTEPVLRLYLVSHLRAGASHACLGEQGRVIDE